MTQDLKALRREMAYALFDLFIDGEVVSSTIESALLRYAQACLRAEASEAEKLAGTAPCSFVTREKAAQIQMYMNAQRAREIES